VLTALVFGVCGLRLAWAAPPNAPTSDLQSAYDAAQAAYDSDNWSVAAEGFRAVLKGMGRDDRSAEIIRVRLADALLQQHQFTDAQTEAQRAVSEFLREGASGPDVEVAAAYQTLGDVLRMNFAYDDAIGAYQQAVRFAAGDDRDAAIQLAQVGIIQAAMVTHPDLAARTADGMIASPDASGACGAERWRCENRGAIRAQGSGSDRRAQGRHGQPYASRGARRRRAGIRQAG
jgi:tetratricopeptide (TPR) repeat protein